MAVALVSGVVPAFLLGGVLCASAYLHGIWHLLANRTEPEEL